MCTQDQKDTFLSASLQAGAPGAPKYSPLTRTLMAVWTLVGSQADPGSPSSHVAPTFLHPRSLLTCRDTRHASVSRLIKNPRRNFRLCQVPMGTLRFLDVRLGTLLSEVRFTPEASYAVTCACVELSNHALAQRETSFQDAAAKVFC